MASFPPEYYKVISSLFYLLRKHMIGSLSELQPEQCQKMPARHMLKHHTVLVPGTSIDIPAGIAFQYQNVSDVDLEFISKNA